MTDFIITNENALRMGVFLFILLLMMGLEAVFPRKKRALPRGHRWLSNLGLVFIDGLFVRLIFPVIAVGIAAKAAHESWGLFNIVDLPFWLEVTLSIIILDMMIYWQHVASHHIPFLWRLAQSPPRRPRY